MRRVLLVPVSYSSSFGLVIVLTLSTAFCMDLTTVKKEIKRTKTNDLSMVLKVTIN